MRVDFTEIPSAAGGTSGADDWEFFARDFLVAIGLRNESGPDRGADGGRDLLMVERREGVLGQQDFRWVVSAKHKAHGGTSVSDKEEIDVLGHVRKFKAQGFITFYSTLASSGLARTLEAHRDEIEVVVYDAARIEHELLTNPKLATVFHRYFPKGAKAWEFASIAPFPLTDVYEPLGCEVCGTDLLTKDGKLGNILLFFEGRHPERVVRVLACCKGECDRAARAPYRANRDVIDRWLDLSDLAIPRRYMQQVMSFMNQTKEGEPVFASTAFDEMKHILLLIAQVVVRETSPDQRARLDTLDSLPPGF